MTVHLNLEEALLLPSVFFLVHAPPLLLSHFAHTKAASGFHKKYLPNMTAVFSYSLSNPPQVKPQHSGVREFPAEESEIIKEGMVLKRSSFCDIYCTSCSWLWILLAHPPTFGPADGLSVLCPAAYTVGGGGVKMPIRKYTHTQMYTHTHIPVSYPPQTLPTISRE